MWLNIHIKANSNEDISTFYNFFLSASACISSKADSIGFMFLEPFFAVLLMKLSVIFTTVPDNKINPIRLGTAISPLNVSEMLQASSSRHCSNTINNVKNL